MKKRKTDILIFVLSALFIVSGFFTMNWEDLQYYLTEKVVHQSNSNELDITLAENWDYHHFLMDSLSRLQRAVGTEYVVKQGSTFVRMDNGLLSEVEDRFTEKYMHSTTEKIQALQEAAEENGAGFLYVICPKKGYEGNYPACFENWVKPNIDGFFATMTEAGVPTLNLQAEAAADGLSEEDLFFATDHHWNPQTGLWASGKICAFLHDAYGFDYRPEEADPSNYDVETYENWFLGSQGKKVGQYFTERGADDFDLITPKFETMLTESYPLEGREKKGTFDELLHREHLLPKNLYALDVYDTYSGGNSRLQVITNQLKPEGKKVLIVRDSFGCAVTPFLSLHTGELQITDLRHFDWFVGEKLNLAEYIEETHPDYVIALFTGVPSGENIEFF